MKRFLTTIVFCASLLALLSYWLFPVTKAAENPLVALINLPAPPPPNPQVTLPSGEYEGDFFSKSKQPPDDAPINVLMDYWRFQSARYQEVGYNPTPSDKVLDRLMAEVQKDHTKVFDFLNEFRDSKKAAELVKEIYDRYPSGSEGGRNRRGELRRWLMYNSPFFSSDLARLAVRAADVNEYVSNQDDVLALGRVDWERARPIVDRLYNGSGKVSRVLAQWALYRNALDNNSQLDTERYRDELKAVVEDKTATDGMRDLAFDALVKEKEWEGRDEWYYTLLSDETLDDLRVNGTTYTGLTTIMYYSPDEKYIDKMVELVRSDNKTVRTAAAKNLAKRLGTNNPDVIRALLPWLQDPKWLTTDDANRNQIVMALQRIKMPESVPALIAALDEKEQQRIPMYSSSAVANAANYAANAARTAANRAAAAAMAAANAVNAASSEGPVSWREQVYYPLRSSAISALGYQGDARALPALRRLLNNSENLYEVPQLVSAIYECGGYTLAEQVDALEDLARNDETPEFVGNMAANAAYTLRNAPIISSLGQPTIDTKRALGTYLSQRYDVKDDLARAVVDRIMSLDRNDAKTANALRKLVMQWHGTAVSTLFLSDLKTNKASTGVIVRLLSDRAELREKQMSSLFEVRTGSPTAVGISACLLEDPNDYEAILDGESSESKAALLACSRLVRAALPVKKVAGLLQSKDALLVNAAERYLESEDSPEARKIVLSLHPNEARILGATTAFFDGAGSVGVEDPGLLQQLFASVSPYYALGTGYVESPEYLRKQTELIETRVQEDLKKDPNLLGVYSWEWNFIHIYKERAVVSWIDDPARYRERTLTPEEFDNFKGLIAHFKADELPPFLSCVQCAGRQLLMVGRNGGRRVYVKTEGLPTFFAELDRIFAELRTPPSTIKYWAGKDVPGLEVVFADDRLDAKAVFKNGGDFRVLTADKTQRVEIDGELEEFAENVAPGDEPEEEDPGDIGAKVEAERVRREYENFAWRAFAAGALGGSAAQPIEVPYIPAKDNFKAQAEDGWWKAQAGTTEIRASSEGLFKISAGKFSQLKTGDYESPVITPNGRWVVVTKYDDDRGNYLVRINIATNKEFDIESGDMPIVRAIAFVPSINRVLVGPYEENYGEDYADAGPDAPEDLGGEYSWLDPETGVVVPARGEVRPLAQQEWRALQPAAGPFEFWAAIKQANQTIVGIYNSRTFMMRTLVTLPKIKFDSEDMWVDAAEGKAYFVYEGHLLSMPIKQGK